MNERYRYKTKPGSQSTKLRSLVEEFRNKTQKKQVDLIQLQNYDMTVNREESPNQMYRNKELEKEEKSHLLIHNRSFSNLQELSKDDQKIISNLKKKVDILDEELNHREIIIQTFVRNFKMVNVKNIELKETNVKLCNGENDFKSHISILVKELNDIQASKLEYDSLQSKLQDAEEKLQNLKKFVKDMSVKTAETDRKNRLLNITAEEFEKKIHDFENEQIDEEIFERERKKFIEEKEAACNVLKVEISRLIGISNELKEQIKEFEDEEIGLEAKNKNFKEQTSLIIKNIKEWKEKARQFQSEKKDLANTVENVRVQWIKRLENEKIDSERIIAKLNDHVFEINQKVVEYREINANLNERFNNEEKIWGRKIERAKKRLTELEDNKIELVLRGQCQDLQKEIDITKAKCIGLEMELINSITVINEAKYLNEQNNELLEQRKIVKESIEALEKRLAQNDELNAELLNERDDLNLAKDALETENISVSESLSNAKQLLDDHLNSLVFSNLKNVKEMVLSNLNTVFQVNTDMEMDLSCLYCKNLLREPITVIPCGHNYCKTCWTDLLAISRKNGKCPCPECRNKGVKAVEIIGSYANSTLDGILMRYKLLKTTFEKSLREHQNVSLSL
eukprot:TRINITY_DN328_c0_g1_i1.p1 TRINITY_DN328_c0_g1~~TRINITY_DN328_c0_g1_i1.p1  ORF type:complete len:639 (-),score=172.46 TRINITY_DN328_c0_g1_i1:94-1968(-)